MDEPGAGPASRIRVFTTLLVGCALALSALPGHAGAVALDPVDTYTNPIYVTSPPGDARLFVVERAGHIKVFKDGATLGTDFLDIHTQTTTEGDRGLLSMAFDPNYATNGLFYVFYTASGTAGCGALGEDCIDEFHVSSNPDVADADSQRNVLKVSRPDPAKLWHNGGQLQFASDGYLYISVGDGFTGGDPAQDPTLLNGKLLRIDPHETTAGAYTIPPDNPFVGTVSTRPEIWAMGLRNPFRFSFDHLDGSLLLGDVGQTAREEVDYAPASTGFGVGANYGWNCREGLIAYASAPASCTGASGFTDPIFDYPHTNPGGDAAHGCAIIGGYVYRGSDIPSLAGRYLYTDNCARQLRSLVPGLPFASGERSEGVSTAAPPYSFGEDSRCELYLTAPPTVYKIVSSAGAEPGPGGCPEPAGDDGAGGFGSVPVSTGTVAPQAAAQFRDRCGRRKTSLKRRRCRRRAGGHSAAGHAAGSQPR